MEDILYKNSPSDIRIREMVSITANLNKHDYSKDYLTFEALEDGTFTLTISKDNYGQTLDITSISYSIDNGNNWVTTQRSADATTTITTPTITQGDKVLWKGIATSFCNPGEPGITSTFSSTGKFNVYGNIMSLLYDDNFEDKVTVPSGTYGNFSHIFYNAVNLINVENLILPATTLTGSCYRQMFKGCTSLTTAPKLPATILANACYDSMFYGCTSLTTAPVLPATTLADYCYYLMFWGCTSLATAPKLPVTTLAQRCYAYMFRNCTSLTTAPKLPATTLAAYCYYNMFWGCTSLITAPELPATTLADNCYNSMFLECSSLTAAPELLATRLISGCYDNMFQDCTNLNYIKAMFTTTPGDYSGTKSWVKNVASNGTFIKNSAAQWTVTGTSGVPSGWTVETVDS